MSTIKCDNLTLDKLFLTQNGGTLALPTNTSNKDSTSYFKIVKGTAHLSKQGSTTVTFGIPFTSAAYGVALIDGGGSPENNYTNALYVTNKTTTSCVFHSRHDETTYFAYIICGI